MAGKLRKKEKGEDDSAPSTSFWTSKPCPSGAVRMRPSRVHCRVDCKTRRSSERSPETIRLAVSRVAEELDLDRFVTERILAQKSHRLVQCSAARLVLMKQIAG